MLNNEQECCGNCKWFESVGKSGDHFCNCPESSEYRDFTNYDTSSCSEWEYDPSAIAERIKTSVMDCLLQYLAENGLGKISENRCSIKDIFSDEDGTEYLVTGYYFTLFPMKKVLFEAYYNLDKESIRMVFYEKSIEQSFKK